MNKELASIIAAFILSLVLGVWFIVVTLDAAAGCGARYIDSKGVVHTMATEDECILVKP